MVYDCCEEREGLGLVDADDLQELERPNLGTGYVDNDNDLMRVLRDGRDLVKRAWTQGDLARDAGGAPVPATAPEACQWCAYGALEAAGAKHHRIVGYLAVHCMERVVGNLPLGEWNDAPTRTQDEVVKAFDAAIDETALAAIKCPRCGERELVQPRGGERYCRATGCGYYEEG